MENQEKKTVLVLEDERPLSNAIKMKLEKSGFGVVIARSVDQAKQSLAYAGSVDAIWVDHYVLGKESGLDFVAWCKDEEGGQCRNTPLFVVSNTASSDKVSSYMHFGVKEYFVKANHRLDEIIESIQKECAV
jgi:DNA-binding NtrC family response regulator